jgi:hypothetical protein
LLAWAQNFYAVANPIATTIGLTSAELTAFNALVTSYQTALAACDPGVRSKAAVVTKNTARASLKASARSLAKLVEAQTSVSDAIKTELGLTVRSGPTPIPPPATPPKIDVVSAVGRTVTLRLHDSTGLKKRGKPDGVDGAAVYSFIGTTPPEDSTAWTFEGLTGRTKFPVQFPTSVAAGAQVWFTAFWFNERKQNGPAADKVTTNIPGGSVSIPA